MNGQADHADDENSVDPDSSGEQEAGNESERESQAIETPSIDELQARADEHWDRYLRAAAEMENVRKRATRDVEHARKYALERFGRELLAVKDSLELGISSAADGGADSLLEGSVATLKLLSSTLQQFGIDELDPAGEPFDPDFHEAISMQPSEDLEPGSVLTVVQKGYALNGRLLRPAMVIVVAE